MANKPKSVYLTERTMSALRPDDSLSARVNQIVDRYLEMVTRDRERVRGKFTAAEWQSLGNELHRHSGAVLTAAQQRVILRSVEDDRALRLVLDEMSGGDMMVLIELLENDRWGEPPATHSQGGHDDAR